MDISNYIEPNGVISNIPNPPDNSSDNGLLMSSEYLIHEYLTIPNHHEREYQLFELTTWFLGRVYDREIRKGLYNRQINQTRNVQAHDDIAGIVVASYLMNLGLCKPIYEELKSHGWFYNTAYSELETRFKFINKIKFVLYAIFGHDVRRSWLFRICGFAATVKVANKKWLTPLDYLMIYLAYKGNYKEPKHESSGRKLLYLYSLVLKGRSKFIDKTIKNWEDKMKEMYGEKWLNEIYKTWYTHPEHPMRDAYKGK